MIETTDFLARRQNAHQIILEHDEMIVSVSLEDRRIEISIIVRHKTL